MPEVRKGQVWTAEELLGQAYTAVDLARRAGVDEAVVTVSRRRGTDFEWRDDQLEKVQEDASRALTCALYVDGRYSTHVTHDLDPRRLAAFVDEAVALTRHLQPDPHRKIPDPRLYEGRSTANLDLVDPTLQDLRRQTRIAWCRSMVEAARADESVISASAQVSDSHGILACVTTNGFAGTEEGTTMVLGAQVTIREGASKRPEAHYYAAGTHQEDLPEPGDVGATALRRALERRGAGKVDSVRTTMVVHPEAAAMLIARALGALTAGAVQQKRSFLAESRGTRIAAEVLSLVDEPLLPRGLGSRHFDREGIAARRLPLVENGVLSHFYVDTYYGHKLDWTPTTGSPSNLVFRHGSRDLSAILSSVDEGILVTSWLGGNANLTTGDFSYGVRGHRIRQGRIQEPISEMNVTGSYGDLLQRLVEVGNDPVPWYACRTPTLVFDGVQFSGS